MGQWLLCCKIGGNTKAETSINGYVCDCVCGWIRRYDLIHKILLVCVYIWFDTKHPIGLCVTMD